MPTIHVHMHRATRDRTKRKRKAKAKDAWPTAEKLAEEYKMVVRRSRQPISTREKAKLDADAQWLFDQWQAAVKREATTSDGRKTKDVDAHVGMLNSNAAAAQQLAARLQRNGFEYRFPASPPTEDMVRHAFRKTDPMGGPGQWKFLNERKNGFHNVTDARGFKSK